VPLWFGSDYLIADDGRDLKSTGARRDRRVDLYRARQH